MAYLYMHKYQRFSEGKNQVLDSYVCCSYSPLPTATALEVSEVYGTKICPHLSVWQTLALASLTLAAKATENPRRLSTIILPAYSLLNVSPPAPPLSTSSEQYDALRSTLVQAEMMLTRVLGFELRVPNPFDFLPRYIVRATGSIIERAENYDTWDKDEKDELGVIEGRDTRLERSCRARVVAAVKDYRLALLFPQRDVALGCLFLALQERGLELDLDVASWIDEISSGKVVEEDFNEVVDLLKKVCIESTDGR
ncbi:hypothetical protein MMC25_005983 [Agyrium rufum]|nr:hypothetical protein [Agyrium rufum]